MTGPAPARRYKGFTPKAGVYRVTHRPSGRSLLGVSPHAEGMLNRIRFQLDLGAHPLAALQRDWTADGAAVFTFELLDVLTPDAAGEVPQADLDELLALWQGQLALTPEQRY